MIGYYKEIFSFVKKKVSSKQIAEDITQETFTRVIQSSNANAIKNERAFLYRVAKNVIIDQIRKNKNINEVCFNEEEFVQDENKTEEKIILDNQTQQLMSKIDNLAKKRKQAFILHVLKGYSKKEVADLMDLSLSAVEKHITRATIQLKDELKEGNCE
ncbi:RNA polymerase subunit sigma [Arcobacter sp. CECT 8989]|uniref:RNA polymerase sigma factor n=1 Tax=Arcobacter sp. CECT 8989 TaxID=2044509 RepID=UPI00100AB970|nr:RNA polymerase sigma factor [Arcobacter sp. CECT 8989]RXK01683.1 RNA polymerase subunit sigma [Arcobacter sp. CECT 8989]